jgi:hypothetical protein
MAFERDRAPPAQLLHRAALGHFFFRKPHEFGVAHGEQ